MVKYPIDHYLKGNIMIFPVKKAFFGFVFLFLLNGCYSNVGVGTTVPLGEHSVIGSNVNLGSDGHLHGNVGIGTDIRL